MISPVHGWLALTILTKLDQLIKQNPSLTPVMANAQQETPPSTPASWQRRLTYQLKVMLKGRAITNISLLLVSPPSL